jgi:D-alanyl-D-alanine carboxypeptidase
MPRSIVLAAATLILTLAVPVAAQDAELWSGPALTTTPMSETDAAVVDQLVEDTMSQAPDLPGLWIGVWDPDEGYYLQAYGDAVKDGEAAAIDQHGRIGSVTKTFTVTAILQQVAAGNLALDSTINEVLPELAEQYPEIAKVTVEQLAGMHSPIQDYANTGVTVAQVIEDPERVFTEADLIAAGMSLPLMDPEVGGYSTTNTIILGLMLEELTGKPVEQVVTEVAASLGMENTALQPPEATLMPEPASHGYVEAIPEGQYGLGLFDYDEGWVGHTGQLIGWESVVVYNTETGAAFVAIVNETGSLLAAEAVAAQLFPDLLGLLGL